MSVPTENSLLTFPDARLIEQALRTLKQSVQVQVETESRLQRLCTAWQGNWSTQCNQLQNRIEMLEARLAPWIADVTEGPRLAVISQHEDAA